VHLKRHVARKDGKEHVYYSLSETIRINKHRTVQRRVLNLGELNTTQTEQWSLKRRVKAGNAGCLPIAKVGLRRMPPMPAKSFYQVCQFDDRGSLTLVG
jgi:hypothetical protein